jgi:hypothetical protein
MAPGRKADEWSCAVLSMGRRDTITCHLVMAFRRAIGSGMGTKTFDKALALALVSSSEECRGLVLAEFLVRLDGEIFRPEFLAIPLGEIDIILVKWELWRSV